MAPTKKPAQPDLSNLSLRCDVRQALRNIPLTADGKFPRERLTRIVGLGKRALGQLEAAGFVELGPFPSVPYYEVSRLSSVFASEAEIKELATHNPDELRRRFKKLSMGPAKVSRLSMRIGFAMPSMVRPTMRDLLSGLTRASAALERTGLQDNATLATELRNMVERWNTQ